MDSPPYQLSRYCRDSTLQESQNPWQAPHNNLTFLKSIYPWSFNIAL